jgi:hypothetical protein
VVKHAPGAQATVDVALSGTGIRIEVADDGNPAGPGGRPKIAAGHGITGTTFDLDEYVFEAGLAPVPGPPVVPGDDAHPVPAHDDSAGPGRRR